ncbi:MAG: M42 family metallopeptidase [Bacteroidota bacterium]|nr:M42 family metallopeptidase [Bacteroidota bacterium]
MQQDSLQFLENYINTPSPTGFEHTGQRVWLDYIKPYINEYFTDTYGTAVGVVNPGKEYKVVIEAHCDEISWFVNYISDDGYIYVRRNGGSDHQIAPSKTVNIWTKNGPIKGIFGWPAIHVRDANKEETPTLKNIFIDCGMDKKELKEKGVDIGCVITFDDMFFTLNSKYYVGRALDNRIGGYMIAQVARMLKENKNELPFTLYIVNAVQEEIGLRGAEMIAHRLKPNLAIVTDVTHDSQSPMYDKKRDGDISCGKGPVLTFGPAVQNNVLDMLIGVAEKKEIAIQKQAVSRSTGTDTDAFAYSNEGVASALISLPLKYMHTTVETVNQSDVEKVIQLMYEFLIQLPAGYDFRYIK